MLGVEIAGPLGVSVLAPMGTATPHHAVAGLKVTGGRIVKLVTETDLRPRRVPSAARGRAHPA